MPAPRPAARSALEMIRSREHQVRPVEIIVFGRQRLGRGLGFMLHAAIVAQRRCPLPIQSKHGTDRARSRPQNQDHHFRRRRRLDRRHHLACSGASCGRQSFGRDSRRTSGSDIGFGVQSDTLIEAKGYSAHDGMGISLARMGGLKCGIITKRICETVATRARDLKLEFVYQGQAFKMKPIQRDLREGRRRRSTKSVTWATTSLICR